MADMGRTSMAEKAAEVYAVAERWFAKTTDWVKFFDKVMGKEGAVGTFFPDKEQQALFRTTEEYAAIQQMIAKLREKEDEKKRPKDPTRMITVRLPASLHAALLAEAKGHTTSVNKLCISKLLQLIDDELVPSDRTAMLRGNASVRETAHSPRRQRTRPVTSESDAATE